MGKRLASPGALVVLSGILFHLWGSGCSSTTWGNPADSGPPLVDSSANDSGAAQDSAAVEASGDDSSQVNTCTAASSTGNATCDSCMEANCCSQLIACVGADAGAAEGGGAACSADYLCIVSCLNSEAGAGPSEAGIGTEGGDATSGDGASSEAGDASQAAEAGNIADCATACGAAYPPSVQALGAAMESCLEANCIGECTTQ